MGKYFDRATPRVRRVDDLTIVVRDKETLFVFARNAEGHIIFHRWFQGRGSYYRWDKFKQRLLNNKSLSLFDCYRIAHEWGVEHQVEFRPVIIKGIEYNFDSKEVK